MCIRDRVRTEHDLIGQIMIQPVFAHVLLEHFGKQLVGTIKVHPCSVCVEIGILEQPVSYTHLDVYKRQA